MNEAMQLEIIENVVLTTIVCLIDPLANAPLNEGQYIQRKRVPIMAMRLLLAFDLFF